MFCIVWANKGCSLLIMHRQMLPLHFKCKTQIQNTTDETTVKKTEPFKSLIFNVWEWLIENFVFRSLKLKRCNNYTLNQKQSQWHTSLFRNFSLYTWVLRYLSPFPSVWIAKYCFLHCMYLYTTLSYLLSLILNTFRIFLYIFIFEKS